ncbi:hypothetical protein B0A49_02915 [Cryomyces minteri]|uniref:Transcription factor CBF/NF-Y/archaeal histone domain-containing protein n=1 Tax=Cryomyces minteri TaxID=331657 RepID=A0A4U0XJK3_9PEZI|nr:hypothetical protein B0A49_02915 [Cryomyces minteri]
MAANKKTIQPLDVLAVLAELEFETFSPRLEAELASESAQHPSTISATPANFMPLVAISHDMVANHFTEYNAIQCDKRNSYRRKVREDKRSNGGASGATAVAASDEPMSIDQLTALDSEVHRDGDQHEDSERSAKRARRDVAYANGDGNGVVSEGEESEPEVLDEEGEGDGDEDEVEDDETEEDGEGEGEVGGETLLEDPIEMEERYEGGDDDLLDDDDVDSD